MSTLWHADANMASIKSRHPAIFEKGSAQTANPTGESVYPTPKAKKSPAAYLQENRPGLFETQQLVFRIPKEITTQNTIALDCRFLLLYALVCLSHSSTKSYRIIVLLVV
jgi:hypothetical protein